MAIRNQPYMKLYVQDAMSDEKLLECSASATGVYFRLLLLMHKSENYGEICLSKLDKKSENFLKNFVKKLEKSLPFRAKEIEKSLKELIERDVIQTNGVDVISQKRMKKDAGLSDIRSDAVDSRRDRNKNICKDFVDTKVVTKGVQNCDSEYEYDTEYENNKNKKIVSPSKTPEIDLSFADPEIEPTFREFVEYRKEIKKPIRSQKSLEASYRELMRLADLDLNAAKEIINRSIANGWQGLFALEKAGGRPANNSPPKSIFEKNVETLRRSMQRREEAEKLRQQQGQNGGSQC